MSSETRVLRPFDALEKTEALMSQMLRVQAPPIPSNFHPEEGNQGLAPLGVSRGSIAANRGTLNLDEVGFLNDAIGLYFGLNDADWDDFIGTAREEINGLLGPGHDPPVSLLVTIYNTRLRKREVLHNVSFRDLEASADKWRKLIVKATARGDRPRLLRMPKDGVMLRVQFVLSRDLDQPERRLGSPWRKGSWLARASVKISAKAGRGLQPTPMTPEIRSRYGLGEKTVVYPHFFDGAAGICEVEDLSDVATFYVDEELLNEFTGHKPDGSLVNPAGLAVQFQWAMTFYRAFFAAVGRDPGLESFDPLDADRHTFLAGVVADVAKEINVSPEEALNILKERPEQFLAVVESEKSGTEYFHELIN